jgi:hypothetical protein
MQVSGFAARRSGVSLHAFADKQGAAVSYGELTTVGLTSISSNQNHRTSYVSTTNFAVTLPSTPADQGDQRRTVTNAYSQVAGMHE